MAEGKQRKKLSPSEILLAKFAPVEHEDKTKKIITMSEVTDEQMIMFYTRYLNEDDIDIEIDGQVTLNNKMGLLTTVDDARESLENIFKNNIDKPNNP